MSRLPHANPQEVTARLRPLLDEPVVAALRSLAAENEVLLVGGALRDRLLGRPVHDFDVVVASGGSTAVDELARQFEARAIRIGGDRFAAYHLDGPDFRLDLWDREGMSLEDDLRRRDLTINSMALRLSDHELIDPVGGLEDLESRTLRATSDRSFSEDPLRVLRLARFLVELPGFAADPTTVRLARAAAPGLEQVAAERIREELYSIFSAAGAAVGLELLAELRLYPALWTSELEAAPAGETHSRLDRLDRAVTQLETEFRPGCVDRYVAAQAVLFLPFPPAVDRLRDFRRRRLLSNRHASAIEALLGWRALPSSDEDRRWFLHRTGDLWPTAASFLGSAAAEVDWRIGRSALIELARDEAHAIFAPRPLLDGHEIAKLLDLAPGPRLGEVAGSLRRAQIEGRVTTRSVAISWLRKLAESAN